MLPRPCPCAMWPPAARSWQALAASPRARVRSWGYLGRGHGIAFVADALVISESTVRTHVKSIYKKLGVNSREELVSKVSEE